MKKELIKSKLDEIENLLNELNIDAFRKMEIIDLLDDISDEL